MHWSLDIGHWTFREAAASRVALAALGCGGRTHTYLSLALRHFPRRFNFVAAADPNPVRLARLAALSDHEEFQTFRDDRAFFAAPRLADVLIIGTQDSQHAGQCLRALEAGYDILLEKPVATREADLAPLAETARRLGRRVLVCHVLRHTPLYQTVSAILASGELGEITSLEATEGVGAFHHAHSYVRGHWSLVETSSPMLVAKSCHDLDLLLWLVGRPWTAVSSFGSTDYFTPAHAPAGATARCADCPHAATCAYSASRYQHEFRDTWFSYVHDHAADCSPADFEHWLRSSPWGRCAYHCDQSTVDRQSVLVSFEGGAVATFTMTPFDEGRSLVVLGTKGKLFAGARCRARDGVDIVVETHYPRGTRRIRLDTNASDHHLGGDFGLVASLHAFMTAPLPEQGPSAFDHAIDAHRLAFAAERARLTRTVVTA